MISNRLARTALRLYPRAWRRRYEDEVSALLEAHRVTYLTFLDLLLGAADAWSDPAYRSKRGPSMSRTETLAGLSALLCYGAAVLLIDLAALLLPAQPPSLVVGAILALYAATLLVMPLLALAIGWSRGFPTWVYPFAGVALLLTFQEMRQPVPSVSLLGFTLLGPASGSPDLLGWRAWLPLLLLVALLLLATWSLDPLRSLVAGIWRDWTQPSFAAYGVLPLVLWILFDEIPAGYRLIYTVSTFLVLLAGALVYLRSGKTWQRVAGLVVAAAVGSAAAGVGSALYWHGLVASLSMGRYVALLSGVGTLVAVLLAPGLIGVARYLLNRRQAVTLRA